ncbi:hypothetical protein N9N17_01810, partial [Schleiferiaceae bacterium]|nr:hypothetical protein [Schleiferiaceae bacterium]
MKSIHTHLGSAVRTRIQMKKFRTPVFALVMAFSMIAPDVMALTGTIHNRLHPSTPKLEGVLLSGDVELVNTSIEEYVQPLSLTTSSAPKAPVSDYTVYAEGIAMIGVSKNDPTNNPSDDVFTLEIGNLEDEDYILSYEVYGITSGAAIPKSINYGVTYREGKLEATQEWSTANERILAKDLKAGENKVHFTLPTHLNAGAKVQNVRMTPVSKYNGVAPAMASFKPLQLDRRGFFDLKGAMHFSVASLDVYEMPSFGTDKFNVTMGAEGYRLLSTGPSAYGVGSAAAFISVKVDKDRLPAGTSLDEVQLYYYDRDINQWAVVPGSRYDEATLSMMAPSVGETDYVAGVLQNPEMPQASGFVPTSISGLDAANPAAGMNLMQPPTANASGAANISYPLEIPAGRNGMQPSLALTYSSDGGSSWVGYGWSLAAPSISVDTRWGAPRFDPSNETELYSYNGQVLVYPDNYLPHRTATEYNNASGKSEYARLTGSVRFFERTTSGYSKIERHGSSTSGYYWTVTTSDNTVYYYGTTNGTTQDGGSTLLNDNGHAVQWYLTKVKDKWGNEITYSYTTKNYTNTMVDMVDGSTAIILSAINYTGHDGTSGKYDIEFTTDTWSQNGYRKDGTVSLKKGVSQADIETLDKIVIKYDGVEVKRYEPVLTTGAFYKMLLTSIREYRSGKLFTEHTLEYFGQPSEIYNSNSGQNWPPDQILTATGVDNVLDLPSPDIFAGDNTLDYASKSSPLSTSKSNGINVGLTVAFGLNPRLNKNRTIGGNVSYQNNWSKGINQVNDFDGDGLPDFGFKSNNSTLDFYPISKNSDPQNLQISAGNVSFNQSTGAHTIKNLSRSSTHSWNYGVEGHFGVGIFSALSTFKWGQSNATSKEYYIDYNSDGIVDLVKRDETDKTTALVFFGYIDSNGKLQFSNSSENTPSPVVKAATVTSPLETFYDKPASMVKVWRAPKTGTVDVSSSLDIGSISSDGVELSIQHSIKSGSSWTNYFVLSPTTKSTTLTGGSLGTTANPYSVNVQKGDLLFFRAHPKNTGIQDYIQWNPEVEYTSGSAVDPSGADWYNSSYENAFLLTSSTGAQVLPSSGNYTISWSSLNVNGLTDDVTFEIVKTQDLYYYDYQTDQEVVSSTNTLYSQTVSHGSSQAIVPGSFSTNPTTINFSLPVSPYTHGNYQLEFIVSSSSNVDWTSIDWRPVITGPNGEKWYPTVRYKVFSDLLKWSGSINQGTVANSDNYVVSPVLSTTPSSVDDGAVGYFTVKAGNKFAGSIEIEKQGTGFNLSSSSISFDGTDIANNSNFYFEFFTDDVELAAYFKGHGEYSISKNQGSSSTNSSTNVFGPNNDLLGTNYRGWGQFGWIDDSHSLIDPLDLSYYNNITSSSSSHPSNITGLDDIDTEMTQTQMEGHAGAYDLKSEQFIYLFPERGDRFVRGENHIIDRYRTLNDSVYVSSFYFKPGRLSEFDDGYEAEGLDFTTSSYSAFGLVTKSESNSRYLNVGAGINRDWSKSTNAAISTLAPQLPNQLTYATSVSGSNNTWNNTWATHMFVDFNGDGYPDKYAVNGTNYQIQFTNPLGGHQLLELNSGLTVFSKSHSTSQTGSVKFGSIDLDVKAKSDANTKASSVESKGTASSEEAKSNALDPSNVAPTDGETSEDPKQQSESTSTLSPIAIDVSYTWGRSNSIFEFIDINGDGLLDQVEKNKNATTGNESVRVRLNKGYSFDSSKESAIVGSGFSISSPVNTEIGNTIKRTVGIGGAISKEFEHESLWDHSWSGGISKNLSYVHSESMFLDLNGDGLTDRIVFYYDQNQVKNIVFINVGTQFVQLEDYTALGYHEGASNFSTTTGIGANLAFTLSIPILPTLFSIKINPSGVYSFGIDRTHFKFTDINGDGFVDFLRTDLTPPDEPVYTADLDGDEVGVWYNQLGTTNKLKSVTNPLGGSFTLDYEVIGNKYGEYDSQIELSSDHSGKTHWDMPMGKWVLKSTTIADNTFLLDDSGVDMDGADYYVTTFKYDGGIHSRRDREFVGFQKVQTLSPSVTAGQLSSITEYQRPWSNDPKKMIQYSVMKGAPRATYQMAFNGTDWDSIGTVHYEYAIYEVINDDQHSKYGWIDTTSALDRHTLEEDVPVFVALIEKSSSSIYEVGATSSHDAKQTFVYNRQMNVQSVLDHGLDVDVSATADDIQSLLTYFGTAATGGRVGQVKEHEVQSRTSGSWVTVRRTTSELTVDKLSTLRMKAHLNASDFAQSDFEYDTYGNVIKMTGPANNTGQRDTVYVTYDNTVHTYPIKVENVFGDYSESTFDFGTGLALTSEDLNGNTITYSYDDFFRVEKILGPNEDNGNADDFTIRYQYFPQGRHPEGTQWEDRVPVAVTYHYQDQGDATNSRYVSGINDDVTLNPGIKEYTYNSGVWTATMETNKNHLMTATFTDGLGRAVQVKKDISVWDGTQQVEKRQVSGTSKVDVRGLPTSQYLSVSEENDETQFPLLRFDRTMSTINPATTTYDYLGRALSASSPDAAGTGSYVATVAYSWETKGGDDFYVTTATDPDGRVSKSYVDARGQQRFTISDPTGVNVETEFFYDVLGQLTSTQSVDGETTTFTYDDFGRMTQEVHPDRGTTSMVYDMLGQVTSTTDANGQTVDYIYDFSRLSEIRYPTSGNLNDITYEYGSRGDGINGAGRVTQITQGSGTTPVMVEKMNYDDLGNVAVHTRDIDVPNIGVQSFTSKTEYDSWGRILNMTYPDGEQLRYFHSYGGDLFRINGYDLGNTNLSAPTEVYVAQLGYDGYGNRTYMEYGNGTKTTFDYNANTLRLNQVTALTSTMNSTGVAQAMLNKTFDYSPSGNINSIDNYATHVNFPYNTLGGSYRNLYFYDGLN